LEDLELIVAMRVLVTGHNGYLGSVMVKVLRAAGHDVVGLDSYFFATTGFGEKDNTPAIAMDVRDVVLEDLTGFESVVHLAALCNDPLGNLNPQWTFEINHVASVRLAKLSKAAGVRRFLFASSCSMYGQAGDTFVTEETPLHPLTPYALSKLRAEQDISGLADTDFCPVFMRNATAYGFSPRFRGDVLLNNLVCWAHTTGKIRIMSDGAAWRPIVHVEDIARAFAAALIASHSAVCNEAFNVGANDENYRVSELAEIVRQLVPSCDVVYDEKGTADARTYRVSFDKLSRQLPAFTPAWQARSGAREVYDAVREAGVTIDDFRGGKLTRLAHFKYLLDTGLVDASFRWK